MSETIDRIRRIIAVKQWVRDKKRAESKTTDDLWKSRFNFIVAVLTLGIVIRFMNFVVFHLFDSIQTSVVNTLNIMNGIDVLTLILPILPIVLFLGMVAMIARPDNYE